MQNLSMNTLTQIIKDNKNDQDVVEKNQGWFFFPDIQRKENLLQIMNFRSYSKTSSKD